MTRTVCYSDHRELEVVVQDVQGSLHCIAIQLRWTIISSNIMIPLNRRETNQMVYTNHD